MSFERDKRISLASSFFQNLSPVRWEFPNPDINEWPDRIAVAQRTGPLCLGSVTHASTMVQYNQPDINSHHVDLHSNDSNDIPVNTPKNRQRYLGMRSPTKNAGLFPKPRPKSRDYNCSWISFPGIDIMLHPLPSSRILHWTSSKLNRPGLLASWTFWALAQLLIAWWR